MDCRNSVANQGKRCDCRSGGKFESFVRTVRLFILRFNTTYPHLLPEHVVVREEHKPKIFYRMFSIQLGIPRMVFIDRPTCSNFNFR